MTTLLWAYNKTAHLFADFDIKFLSNYKPIQYFARTGMNLAFWIEKYIMNGTVKLVSKCAKKLSEFDLRVQNGNIQRYNLYAFIILTIIIVCLVIADLAIIMHLKGVG